MTVLNAELTAPEATESLPTVYLFPGQLFTANEPAMVTTILGSCVAVCLWDDEALVGGINHFLLATNPMRGGDDARYGNTAMARLLGAVVDRGAQQHRIVAKIFGGASVVTGFTNARASIGEQNIAVARAFLQVHGIAVAGEQTGGHQGRKLLFHTGTGRAYVKEISK